MASDSSPSALRARLVLPLTGPPLAGGIVTIEGAKIVSVGTDAVAPAVLDLGDVAILPGLINAHTHLEFSDLPAPIGHRGARLTDWLSQVVSQRRAAAPDRAGAIEAGLRESVAGGACALGDIATFDWRQAQLASGGPPLTAVVFHESIGPTPERVAPAARAAEEFLSAAASPAHLRPGLSPHAPYTVHPRLLERLIELSRRMNVPVAMHLAESRAELELLAGGTGAFREMLEGLNAWHEGDDSRYRRAGDYLEQLARAPRALVIHGNYLTEDEARFVARCRDTMTLVYCPRTHDFFRHEPYPLAQRLALGVSLALGTDSRASNPDLNMFAEARFVAVRHPDVSPRQVLELATLGGARALGWAGELGSLAPGKRASFTVVGPIEGNASDPHELLFDQGPRVLQTWIDGQLAYNAGGKS